MKADRDLASRRHSSRRSTSGVACLLIVGLSSAVASAEPPPAGGFHLVPPVFPGILAESSDAPPAPPSGEPAAGVEAETEDSARSLRRPLWDRSTVAVFLGTSFVLTPVVGYLQWWKRESFQSFHFSNERWFQRSTYAGGADKASHFYYGTIGEEALIAAYQKLGHPPREARWLALANSALSAVVIEVGDAFTSYGFSWQDAAVTTAGAGAYALVASQGWQDTVGFRFGWLPTREPMPSPGPTPHLRWPPGRDALETQPLRILSAAIQPGYTYEIYTVDFKLAGLLPRIHLRPGALRYFLLSATYGTRGYTEAPPEFRERNIGLEIGIDFPEVLRALGVSEQSWWGKPLILFLEHFRVPYSAFGFRYDANSGRWHGLDFGDKYNPGLAAQAVAARPALRNF